MMKQSTNGSKARKGTTGTMMTKKSGAGRTNTANSKSPTLAGRTKADKPKTGKTVHANPAPLYVPRKPSSKKVFNAGAYERARSNHFNLKK